MFLRRIGCCLRPNPDHLQFASSTIHFGLDPLSRRSLLLRIPDTSPCEPTADETRALKESAFILTSCRSPEARSRGLDFKALDGGKTGLLDLKAIRVENGVSDGTSYRLTIQIIDTSSALRMWTRTVRGVPKAFVADRVATQAGEQGNTSSAGGRDWNGSSRSREPPLRHAAYRSRATACAEHPSKSRWVHHVTKCLLILQKSPGSHSLLWGSRLLSPCSVGAPMFASGRTCGIGERRI